MSPTSGRRSRAALLAAAVLVAAALGAASCGGSSDLDRPDGPAAGGGAAGRAQEAEAEERRGPLLEGGERVVFIGDSLAVEAPPSYPELLPEALGGRADGVRTVNLAEPGTTAADWSAGEPLFRQRLAPELTDADLIVVTLGGNDLQEALGGSDGLDAAERADAGSAAGALAAVDRFGRRLRSIFAAIRRRSPGTRIAYVGYPDYSRATAWRETGGTRGTLALSFGLSALTAAAADAGPDLLVDMRDSTGRAGVDSLLADTEHLGPAGHELYARKLAAALTRPERG
jgi:lysophospholipase L1-like esterase